MRRTILASALLIAAVQGLTACTQEHHETFDPAAMSGSNATPRLSREPDIDPATITIPAGTVIKAQDTKGSPDLRAWTLVKQMTIEEKVRMLSGAQNGFATAAVERLGIGQFEMSDGPNGVRNGRNNGQEFLQACALPCGAALAATWDADMATAYGKAVGLEGRARGTQYQLGPGLNICRVPVNGRNFEYFGEDPYLSSVMATNWAKACSQEGVVPVIKHFAANNQETSRNSVNAVVDERVMHEIYLPAFKKAVQEAGNIAVMCSYNRLNGSYASNNDWLQNEVLRKTWGFKGLVMSDWGESHQPSDILKGLDLEMPSGQNLIGNRFQQLVDSNQAKAEDLHKAIDQSIQRLLRTAAAEGWLDAGWKQRDESLPLDSPASAKTALDIARGSIVLLKNSDHLLPLDKTKVKNIVLLGPNATRIANGAPAPTGGGVGGQRAQRGGTSAPNIGGGGSGAVTPFPAHDDEGDYYASIKKLAGDKVNVAYLPVQAGQIAEDISVHDKITEADAVFVVVGFNRGSEAEGRDRSFELPADQQALIAAAAKANPKTIVITNAGGGVGMTGWINDVPTIIHGYYLGQEGGTAIAETVFGDNNPSGHLISVFDAKWEDNPAFPYYPGKVEAGLNYPTEPYTEGLFYGYRGYDKAGKAPLFPFGHGLSYTTFDLTNLKLTKSGDTISVSFDLKNTGKRDGTQVVQLYVGEQDAAVPRPIRELKAFAKITLRASQSAHRELVFKKDAFSYWSPNKRDWTVDSGKTFTIEVGFSERDIKAKAVIGP